MTLTRLAVSACVSAAMAALPATAASRAAQECPADTPAAASYSTLRNVQYHALRARYDAEELKSIAFDTDVSWHRHADELLQLKYEIDSMGQSLCGLQTVGRAVAPSEGRSIRHMVTELRLMADNAQDAIVFLNGHQQDLWMPVYRKYVNNLYSQAHNLTISVGHAIEYAGAGVEASS